MDVSEEREHNSQMLLTEEENHAIQKAGANNRALGGSFLDNPYLRRNLMPIVTGETHELWIEKYDAWELGWHMEDAMRPSALSQLLSRLTT